MSVQVKPLEESHLDQVCRVLTDSFRGKRCCFVFPFDMNKKEMLAKYKNNPGKMSLGAVAVETSINGSSEHVIGVAQLSKVGFEDINGIHKCEQGEMYLDHIAVSPDAQGKGAGSMLMKWCEDMARAESGISRLTLSVLKGNRALGLYQRVGFEITPHADDGFWDVCCVTLIMGRPYGLCNPGWGSYYMVKNID